VASPQPLQCPSASDNLARLYAYEKNIITDHTVQHTISVVCFTVIMMLLTPRALLPDIMQHGSLAVDTGGDATVAVEAEMQSRVVGILQARDKSAYILVRLQLNPISLML